MPLSHEISAMAATLRSRLQRGLERTAVVALITVLPAACAETGPVFPTSSRLDPWVTASGALDPGSDRAPAVAARSVSFRLAAGERRSALRTGREFGLGQTYLIGFDIRLDPATAPARPVVLSRFLRPGPAAGIPDSEIAAVLLDARRGVSVMGRTCIRPADLGQWHSVEMRIAMADDDSGFLEVFCDRRPVWAQAALRTTWPPICRRSSGCTAPVPGPVRFEWQVGLIAPAGAPRPLSVEMQRIFYHRLFVIPNRVGTL